MDKKLLHIDGRPVGDGAPCYIIAEIGSNHNQSLDMAKRLIDAATAAGVDAVKFQTFRAAEHYSKRTPGFTYLDGQDTWSLIQSLELDRSWNGPLMEHAQDRGVTFFSSPCDSDAIDGLEALNAPAYKVASFDLPDTGLIRLTAKTGKPVILSTGMATLADVQDAVDACRAEGNNQVVLLQCTSLYPAPASMSNLRAMETIRMAFGKLVGYSDHTEGDHVALAAVALGACMVEKHFTLDRSFPGPDHPFAIEPDELGQMVRRIREVEDALGDGIKNGPWPQEEEMFEKGRRSLHARTDIAEGESITADMLCVKRPGLGLAPRMLETVVGRVAKKNIPADSWITWDMV